MVSALPKSFPFKIYKSFFFFLGMMFLLISLVALDCFIDRFEKLVEACNSPFKSSIKWVRNLLYAGGLVSLTNGLTTTITSTRTETRPTTVGPSTTTFLGKQTSAGPFELDYGTTPSVPLPTDRSISWNEDVGLVDPFINVGKMIGWTTEWAFQGSMQLIGSVPNFLNPELAVLSAFQRYGFSFLILQMAIMGIMFARIERLVSLQDFLWVKVNCVLLYFNVLARYRTDLFFISDYIYIVYFSTLFWIFATRYFIYFYVRALPRQQQINLGYAMVRPDQILGPFAMWREPGDFIRREYMPYAFVTTFFTMHLSFQSLYQAAERFGTPVYAWQAFLGQFISGLFFVYIVSYYVVNTLHRRIYNNPNANFF